MEKRGLGGKSGGTVVAKRPIARRARPRRRSMDYFVGVTSREHVCEFTYWIVRLVAVKQKPMPNLPSGQIEGGKASLHTHTRRVT